MSVVNETNFIFLTVAKFLDGANIKTAAFSAAKFLSEVISAFNYGNFTEV